jgi:hypothetical protein
MQRLIAPQAWPSTTHARPNLRGPRPRQRARLRRRHLAGRTARGLYRGDVTVVDVASRHRRFALHAVTYAGVAMPGATMDCWQDARGQARWSARVVTRSCPAVAAGKAGRSDRRWPSHVGSCRHRRSIDRAGRPARNARRVPRLRDSPRVRRLTMPCGVRCCPSPARKRASSAATRPRLASVSRIARRVFRPIGTTRSRLPFRPASPPDARDRRRHTPRSGTRPGRQAGRTR